MIEVWSGHEGSERNGLKRERGTGKGGERAAARVLVVDDNPSILDTVSSILEGEGHQVAAASGGEEALSMARAWHPTLVLLDMRMPIMDGWAVAKSLRDSGSRVPIVVMTAAENASRWADEIGAAGHLDKPFGLDELLAVVERHAGPRQN